MIPHDDTRRVLAVGRARGGSPLLQVRARFGDIQATGTREAAARQDDDTLMAELAGAMRPVPGEETAREAGRRAWRIRQQQGGGAA